MAETKDQAAEAQQTFFRITDNVPEEAWYWAALGSIGVSAHAQALRQGRLGHLRRAVAAHVPPLRPLPPPDPAERPLVPCMSELRWNATRSRQRRRVSDLPSSIQSRHHLFGEHHGRWVVLTENC